MKLLSCIFPILLASGCQSGNPVKLVFPDKIYRDVEWTVEDLKKDIAIRHLHRSTTSSTHLIRLKGNESPHYHDHHNLTVSVLSGTSTIHFKDHEVSLLPGDVVFIPKGTFHWAENTSTAANIVFAVFSPAFDGKDRRKAE